MKHRCVKTFNVETMEGKAAEWVETMKKRRAELCCLQKTRWKTNLEIIVGGNSRNKFLGCGNNVSTSGVGN